MLKYISNFEHFGQGLQMEKKTISLEELYPTIEELLSDGRSFELPVRGTSMNPCLKEGRDSVLLIRTDDFGLGDIAFYRRNNGQFVLHRIVAVLDGGYDMCGDNQEETERGIQKSQIIGIVSLINRDGKTIDRRDPKYMKKVNFWIKNINHRHIPLVIMRKLSK